MVRTPCCEKMGLKKGPWTPEEDQILIAHVQRYGHENWRALPKQAGLLRCGKSCRLRWINYLRPDVKRGNFTKEEEEAIIGLHEMLGNRWSAIAARLPGRTDNEIKNVWHTHLKKRVNRSQAAPRPKREEAQLDATTEKAFKHAPLQLDSVSTHPRFDDPRLLPVSPEQSCSDFSCTASDSSAMSGEKNTSNAAVKVESFSSFWLEALSMDNFAEPMDFAALEGPAAGPSGDLFGSFGASNNDDTDFWLRVFMEASDLQA